MAEIKNIIAVIKNYPDTARVTSVVLEYDSAVSAGSVLKECFDVADRNITSARVLDNINGEQAESGRFVSIDMDVHDRKASVLTDLNGRHVDDPKPMPEGKRPFVKPEPIIMPDGREFRGPHGLKVKRDPVDINVKQVKSIIAEDGSLIDAWVEYKHADVELNEAAERFTVKRFKNIDYDLFIPGEYDPDEKYPLVFFIHDAGVIGKDPRIVLEQGIGAVVWTSDDEQKKHPCFVAAPQCASEFPVANDNYWCTDELAVYKELIRDLVNNYSIDTERIYLTGQSMGFMSSLQMMIEEPCMFAGALLAGGHWDVQKTAGLWQQNIWMFLSEGDYGARRLFVLPEEIEKLGGSSSVRKWSADKTIGEINDLVKEQSEDEANFKMSIITGDSVRRFERLDEEGYPHIESTNCHLATWHLVYRLETARDWLFKQYKKK